MAIVRFVLAIILLVAIVPLPAATAEVLDKQKQLDAQTFWDNRDWDWYAENIPFFECPDPDITTTYYYRWELLTKHLTYGSPNSGYSFTEFIDRPFWSGAYGAISCPAGLQLYEARWLRQPTVARDYLRYWFRTPGAQPRNYSTWLADSAWAVNLVHHDDAFLTDLLADLVKNYEGWEQRHFVPEVGLFWQTGHDDGMEFNINSRQTKDILRGAPSYRPSFNAYMWADATAIAKIAMLAGHEALAKRFSQKAESLRSKVRQLLWDDHRKFFFPAFKNDEERDGHTIRALSRTYETGQFAGDAHGRELIGYVPWQFKMFEKSDDYEAAWSKLMDRDGFFADFGPSTVERNDPMFLLQKSCCWWSGQSWPYATTQTLKALANVLQRDTAQNARLSVSNADYLKLLAIYARSHRKQGQPYLAEALHPDTGSFEGHDGYNHSEHYFHSGFCDLVITGLIGLIPGDGDTLEVRPLAPPEWDYFAIDDLAFRGRRVSVVWDKTGQRYGLGAGLRVLVDGKTAASAPILGNLTCRVETQAKKLAPASQMTSVNFVVNNDGTYFPHLTGSYSSQKTPLDKVNDGNYWYVQHPPNRWTCEGSPNERDWVIVDFGTPRPIHTVKLYVLDDRDASTAKAAVQAPAKIDVEAWVENQWRPIDGLLVAADKQADRNSALRGHRANIIRFDPLATSRLRVTLQHAAGAKSGLTEIEAWGDARLPLELVPPPAGNLAFNPKPDGYPKASASFTDRFGGNPASAVDGKTVFLPSPMNRWTSYESKSPTDWIEIDFGKEIEFRRVELAIYDDRGGVQAPTSYSLQYWNGADWQAIGGVKKIPEQPLGGQWNEVRFDPVKTAKLRVVFVHKGQARSGVSELHVWND